MLHNWDNSKIHGTVHSIIYLLMEFIGWHRWIKPYRFQVHSSRKHHLPSLHCALITPKEVSFRPHLSPFCLPLPPSLSPPPSSFPSGYHHTVVCVFVLYVRVCARVYIYIYTHIYCFCVTFHLFFTQPPNPLPSDCCQSVLCIWVCLNCTLETYFLWYVNYILIKWFKTINGSIC